jgi:glycosyltransferase involved in cell wall biosynthesis
MVLILTPYSFDPLHPRLEYIEKVLLKSKYKVVKINLNSKNRIFNILNWWSLTFFQNTAILKSPYYLVKYYADTKIVYIQDLKYIPIALFAKLLGKKVVYETLDNNVELNFYHLSNRLTALRKFVFIKRLVCWAEKVFSKLFCDEVIVNSKALVEYFDNLNANLIYYASPFENKNKNENKNVAFLYLGGFWKMKGADIILDTINEYHKKIFIFGSLNMKENELIDKIKLLEQKHLVSFKNRMSSSKLKKELDALFQQYSLLGFSLTQEVNISNATQEINKDIDYLSMGIPIIGNHRKPTEEKVKEGCGVFIENKYEIKKLIEDKDFYEKISRNCYGYYHKTYSQNIFEKKLLKIIRNVYEKY